MNFIICLHEMLDGIMESDYLVDCLPEEYEIDLNYRYTPGRPAKISIDPDRSHPEEYPGIEFCEDAHYVAVEVCRSVEHLIPYTVAYTGDIFKLKNNICNFVQMKMDGDWQDEVLKYESECHDYL